MYYKMKPQEAKKLSEVTSLPIWTEYDKYLRAELHEIMVRLTSETDPVFIHRYQGQALLLAEILKLKDDSRQAVEKFEANPRKI